MGGLPLFNIGIQNRGICCERQSIYSNSESKSELRVQSPVGYSLGYHFTPYLASFIFAGIFYVGFEEKAVDCHRKEREFFTKQGVDLHCPLSPPVGTSIP